MNHPKFPALDRAKLQPLLDWLLLAGWIESAVVVEGEDSFIHWNGVGLQNRRELFQTLQRLGIRSKDVEILPDLAWICRFYEQILPAINEGD